jgi:hypothetical protein
LRRKGNSLLKVNIILLITSFGLGTSIGDNFEEPLMIDNYIGVCYHAMMHKNFPYRKALKAFEGVNKPALGVLWATFGNSRKGLKLFMDQSIDKPHAINFYLMNHTCVRGSRQCTRDEIRHRWSKDKWNQKLSQNSPFLQNAIRRRVKKIRKFVERHGNANTDPYLTVALEDNLTNTARKKLIRWVKKDWPYMVVSNPVGNNPNKSTYGTLWEDHHTTAVSNNSRIMNLDGEDIRFPHRNETIDHFVKMPQLQTRFNKSAREKDMSLLWTGMHQGLHTNGGMLDPNTLKDPKDRDIIVMIEDVMFFNNLLIEAQNQDG